MFKKIITLFVMFFFGYTAKVSAEKLVLGYVDFPPYEYKKENHAKGILVDIVKLLFHKANIEIELRYLPFKRAYEETKDGKIDGLFNFYKTEKRLGFFDYSEPIIENPLVWFVRKDSKLQLKSIEELKGLTIGVMRGYTYGIDFDESPIFIRDETNSHVANIKKLVYGRIDAYPCDKMVGIYVALNNNLMTELKVMPTPLKVMEGHIGFTKGRHKKTIKMINPIIIKMKQNGQIDDLINKFINGSL